MKRKATCFCSNIKQYKKLKKTEAPVSPNDYVLIVISVLAPELYQICHIKKRKKAINTLLSDLILHKIST